MPNLNARIRMKTDTTEAWSSVPMFVPLAGELIVYSDYAKQRVDDIEVPVPNFKIGDGNAYLVDLPFVGDDLRARLTAHMNDAGIHITEEEREFWNNKVRCYTEADVSGEQLIFTTD